MKLPFAQNDDNLHESVLWALKVIEISFLWSLVENIYMGWINPMILIISWTTLLICFCDITVTSYAQKYQKCIDLGDNGVLSMNKKMKNK